MLPWSKQMEDSYIVLWVHWKFEAKNNWGFTCTKPSLHSLKLGSFIPMCLCCNLLYSTLGKRWESKGNSLGGNQKKLGWMWSLRGWRYKWNKEVILGGSYWEREDIGEETAVQVKALCRINPKFFFLRQLPTRRQHRLLAIQDEIIPQGRDQLLKSSWPARHCSHWSLLSLD